MARRRRSWYRTDLLAVLGLALLIAWVPAYMGQSEAEHEAAATDGWVVRAPRDGDRVVMDLVASWSNGTEMRLQEALSLTFRAVPEGEVPWPAAMAIERATAGFDVRVGGLQVHGPSAVETIYFDAEGRPVERTSDGTYARSTYGNETIEYQALQRGAKAMPWMGRVPDRFEHTSSSLDAALGTFRQHGRGGEVTTYGRGAAVYGGELLFAGDGEHLLDEAVPIGSAGWKGCSSAGTSHTWWNGLDVMLHAGHCEGTGWEWFLPDFPVAVGTRIPVFSAEIPDDWRKSPKLDELLGHVDLLPSSVQRGEGAELPFLRTADRDAPRDLPVSTLRPTATLGDLEERDTPLLLGASLANVTALLDAEDAPATVRTLREEGAQVVALIWRTRDAVAEEPQAPGPVGDLLPPSLTRHHPVTWEFVLYLSEERWTVVGLATEMREDGTVTLMDMEDLCLGSRTCDGVWSPRLDLSAPVIPPAAFLPAIKDRLGRDDADLPGVFYWAPFWSVDNNAFPPRATSVHIPNVLERPPDLRPTMDGGVVTWAEDWEPEDDGWLRFGTFNLADGSAVSDVRWRPLDDRPAGEPLTPVADVVEYIEPLPPLVGVGLFLILLALLLRALRFLLGGGQYLLVAAGYAKIAPSEVLTHERRQEIMDALSATPGLTATQLQRRLRYGWGATVHHLETLVKAGQLDRLQFGRRRHYYPKGTLSEAERLRLAAASDPEASRLLQAVQAHPGVTAGDLVRLTARSRTAISRTASRLERTGLLEKRREGVRVLFHPVRL